MNSDNVIDWGKLRELERSLHKPVDKYSHIIIHNSAKIWGRLVVKNLHYTDCSMGVTPLGSQPLKIKIFVKELGQTMTCIMDTFSPKNDNSIHAVKEGAPLSFLNKFKPILSTHKWGPSI